MMENWQGTGLAQQQFFEQQEQIPVEISPEEPNLTPLRDFSAVAGIHGVLARNIVAAGYRMPTPVQKWGIPLLLTDKDVMACAQTGSGKTAFYLFPPINSMLHERQQRVENPPSPAALILGPTRELCVQIFEEAQKFTQNSGIKVGVVYGGTDYKESFRQLNGGVDILVATSGRLSDLCERKQCSVRFVKRLVLDEADRMLDLGFEPQIRQIVQKLGMPKKRQTTMTSATFPPDVQHLAQEFMETYSFMTVGRVGGAASTIEQQLEWVEDTDKDMYMIGLLLQQPVLGLFLIFVNTKQQAFDLERLLQRTGFNVGSIHGDRTQEEREAALEAFKSGTSPILIATDVAARGLDIPNVAVVVQYDLAMSIEDYVHRIGRTGRIGKTGIAVGMVNNRNKGVAPELCGIFEEGGKQPPAFLVGMALSTGNYEPGSRAPGQQQYGGQDVRKSLRKGFQTAEEREQAKKFTNFAKDAYGQGNEAAAELAAASIGPALPGAYHNSANKGKAKGNGKGKGGGKGGNGGYGDGGGMETVRRVWTGGSSVR